MRAQSSETRAGVCQSACGAWHICHIRSALKDPYDTSNVTIVSPQRPEHSAVAYQIAAPPFFSRYNPPSSSIEKHASFMAADVGCHMQSPFVPGVPGSVSPILGAGLHARQGERSAQGVTSDAMSGAILYSDRCYYGRGHDQHRARRRESPNSRAITNIIVNSNDHQCLSSLTLQSQYTL